MTQEEIMENDGVCSKCQDNEDEDEDYWQYTSSAMPVWATGRIDFNYFKGLMRTLFIHLKPFCLTNHLAMIHPMSSE